MLIVGAGMAGLTAANELSRAGVRVTILEGRERAGGRIHTVPSRTGNMPVELGAEFVHGEKNETWEIIRAAKLKTQEVPNRHWQVSNATLTENLQFWEQLQKVSERIDPSRPDQNFQSFLHRQAGLEESTKWLAKEYVEGFHAAPPDRMSIRALAKAEAAAQRDGGTRQFRLALGYSHIVQWLLTQLISRRVTISYSTVARLIRWERGKVEIEAQTPNGTRTFSAERAIVALPLGVLKERGEARMVFEPALSEKEEPLRSLEMGTVVKVTLQFRSRFWPVENFGFVHSNDPSLPTWWADERGDVLTGWAGGPRAERLSPQGRDTILAEAVRALSGIFQVEREKIQDLMVADHMHDWLNDPFARGAYSFTPAGMIEMPKRLAAPVADTLFFAGEATDFEGEQGTVHGAITSGKRAAKEIQELKR